MTEIIGNPFFWGFSEQRAINTLAKRGKAIYNKPREVVEQKTALENFFEQNISTSANTAHVVGFNPIIPEPYVIPSSSSNSNNNCEEDKENIEEDITETEEEDNDNF